MYTVDVFPLGPRRRIAVIEGPGGPFSTEAGSPVQIEDQARAAIAEVLGDDTPPLTAVDEHGHAWDLDVAATQVAALKDR